jgi:hypothetical protein
MQKARSRPVRVGSTHREAVQARGRSPRADGSFSPRDLPY